MNRRYAIRDICDVTFWQKNENGKEIPILKLDVLKTNSFESTNNTTYARGGRNNNILSVHHDSRELQINVTDSIFDPKMNSMLFGTPFVEVSGTGHGKTVNKHEKITIKQGKSEFVLNQVPSDMDSIVVMNDDGLFDYVIDTLSFSTTPEEEFTIKDDYTEGASGTSIHVGQVLTIHPDLTITEDVSFDIYYNYEIQSGQILTMNAEKFANCTYKLTASALVRDIDVDGCAVDRVCDIVIHRAMFMGDFNLPFEAEGEPISMEFQLMALPHRETKELMSMTIH